MRTASKAKTTSKSPPYYLRRALGTWQWYALWVVFLLNTTVGLAIYSTAKAMAGSIGGATAAVASAFVVFAAVAGFGAPLLLARSMDLTGSYDFALYATGGLMLIGAVIPLALRTPRPAR